MTGTTPRQRQGQGRSEGRVRTFGADLLALSCDFMALVRGAVRGACRKYHKIYIHAYGPYRSWPKITQAGRNTPLSAVIGSNHT